MNRLFAAVLLFTLLSITAAASEPSVWTVNSRSAVLRGDARGVSIDANGTITLAPKLTEVYKTEQPYIWSSAIDTSGNVYLGTGGDGRIFKVSGGTAGALFADLTELNVTAMVVGSGGDLFAATSPDGKVYRIDSAGKVSVYFEPKEKYIWSLSIMADGSLAVGTGEGGKIFRVRGANSAPDASLMFDTSETHIISLAVDKQGNLYAGTDSNGLVMRFGADGKPFGVLDSPLREVHQLAVGPDGSIYALALGESASVASPTPVASLPAATDIKASPPAASVTEPPQKSRYDLAGAKSAVYRILPDGGTDIIWSSPSVTGFSLYAHQTGNGVLLGTSDKGRIYNVSNDGRETLVLQSDVSQISTIRGRGNDLFATSSNQGRLFKVGADTLAEGTYESSVLDAKSSAAWGRIWWNSSGNVQIQTRSGNTEKPDETWSQWGAAGTEARSGQIASPKARYLQWRAVLRSGSTPAVLNETSVAYLPRNIAPEVLSIQVLPTNIGLLPNPAIQVDPNIELSGLDPSVFGIPSVQPVPRRAFQRGARALQWTAEDRNGDKLVYDVYYKELGDANYKPLRENIAENFLTIDGQSLADGRYTVRIVAKDSRENPAGQSLTGERLSEPFDIDNTAPAVTAVSGNAGTAIFAATDKSSYINKAEYSINGGEWLTVYADDGIADSPNERFTVKVPDTATGEIVVTLRVFDSNGNSGNARVLVKR
jgi:sugar lactone lactonase YvrE